MKSASELSFSDDINLHVKNALDNLLTLDLASVVGVDPVSLRVNLDIEVRDDVSNSVKKLNVKNIRYLSNIIAVTDSSGKTVSVQSYIPEVGDHVLIAYVGKSFNQIVVIGKLGV